MPLKDEEMKYFNTPEEALRSRLESVGKLVNAGKYIVITATDDGKGGWDVQCSRQGLSAEETANLIHIASKAFHDFDEKEKEVNQMVSETAEKRPEWLTDEEVSLIKEMYAVSGNRKGAIYYIAILLQRVKKTMVLPSEAEEIFEKYCK